MGPRRFVTLVKQRRIEILLLTYLLICSLIFLKINYKPISVNFSGQLKERSIWGGTVIS